MTSDGIIHRVGVVTDTHVGEVLPSLPPGVLTALAGVDLIIHAGDITTAGVLERLRTVAPVVAVRGNHDGAIGVRLPRHAVVQVGDVRIGVTHGTRHPAAEALMVVAGIVAGRPVTWGLHRALRRAVGDVDCLVFGHYHMPVVARHRGTLVFSPGAAYVVDADDHYAPHGLRGLAFRRFRRGLPDAARVPAVGILEVCDGVVTPTIVPVDGPVRWHRGP